MKKIATILIILSLITGLKAQNAYDALRYSYTSFGGTARSMGMAGAFGALGADFSSLSTNPAGMGLYNMSEITLSPTFFSGSSRSDYNGSRNNDYRLNFNFSNIGMVSTTETSGTFKEQGWKNTQFGFGFNKLINFNNRFHMEGINQGSSILTEYYNNSQGTHFTELGTASALAYATYLIDTTSGSVSEYSYDYKGQRITQSKDVETIGSMNEMVVAASANYDDRLYIGGSLNFPWIRYTERSNYTETEIQTDTITNFYALHIDDYLKTKGTGVNVKFGIIYRATEWLRLGGSIHTPTFYSLSDEYSRDVSSEFDSYHSEYDSEVNESGEFDYVLTTPFRASGSMAFIIGKIGVINADIEYVDYSNPRLDSDEYRYKSENNTIREIYRDQRNYRIGGELNLAPFTIRSGFAYYGSPFHTSFNDASRKSYSLGFGYRETGFFMDLAFVYSVADEEYFFYDPGLVNPVENRIKGSSLVFTMGFRY